MNGEVIQTRYGKVIGIPSDTQGVTVFKGIPIGADTGKENRFRAPQPPKSWEGVRGCDHYGDRFLQNPDPNCQGAFWFSEFNYASEYRPPVSENGLVVNIYQPEVQEGRKLPVYVWIHGGAGNYGSASDIKFDATKLAAKGVIVVLVQYRLGFLGWLTLPELCKENEHGACGNYAVHDNIFALKWVQENIEAFGGAKNKVTIGGQSAGAMQVMNLLRSPLAKGLFQRAIIQSGLTGFLNDPGAMGEAFGAGKPFPTVEEAATLSKEAIRESFGRDVTLKELREMEMEEFLKPPFAKNIEEKGVMPSATILEDLAARIQGTVLDGYVFTEESIDLMNPRNIEGIDIIMGGTTDEMTSLMAVNSTESPASNEILVTKLKAMHGEDILSLYSTSTKEESYASFLRAFSDDGLQRLLLSAGLNQVAKKPFVYSFAHVAPGKNEEFYGAYHSGDLWFTMGSLKPGRAHREWRKLDWGMMDVITDYWSNFIKTGNPNRESLSEWIPCDEKDEYPFMQFKDGQANLITTSGEEKREQYFRKRILESLNLN
ncbi:carboxylesterase family protein [Viridibacillus sp. FSL R5-0477]|uniref:Carboxylic ester hydrolase n=1 Tax=Viridibacillus arenosi FSL R5-213 TaxID=1227360 RepID=W4F050_9BACL|nr:carboxylesterase family protein [Viridibacillus arenosi]ETT86160.1 Carboxylesterase, type B [Viridibacillus arenosi FSL R5-213]OMC91981.1 hypothetical protein BK137_08740 [Viridibacillus arenosi]